MINIEVYFTEQIDSENRGIEVFQHETLIANGHLNICTNVAHVNSLGLCNQLEGLMDYDIEKAIEERNILQSRIQIN
tara:strand:+ start:1331 stop:1561 length:231 start_codon:yes stop_codon:yes gene_type:complete